MFQEGADYNHKLENEAFNQPKKRRQIVGVLLPTQTTKRERKIYLSLICTFLTYYGSVARLYTYLFNTKILMMSFGTTGDFIAISSLAMRVHIAYKEAPGDYRYISEDIAVLQVLMDEAAQHFKSAIISSDDRHDGQRVLENCQGVLEDLNSLIEKYKRRASTNRRFPFMGVKVVGENIVTLHERLIIRTGLLNGFVQRFVILPLSII